MFCDLAKRLNITWWTNIRCLTNNVSCLIIRFGPKKNFKNILCLYEAKNVCQAMFCDVAKRSNIVCWAYIECLTMFDNFAKALRYFLFLDPWNWTSQQVCQFVNWLVGELSIQGVEANQFRMNGIELCNLSKQDLSSHFPSNLVDVLWMYLETLKFGKFLFWSVIRLYTRFIAWEIYEKVWRRSWA